MNRTKIINLSSAICYLVMIVAGVVMAIVFRNATDAAEGLGGVLVALFSAILMVAGVLYALFGIIPLVLKLIHLARPKRIFPIFSIPFDLCYLILNGVLLVQGVGEGSVGAILVFGALMLISVSALILNILGLVLYGR